MIKKYLVKSAAALVMGFAAAACSHDFSVEEQATQQSIDNAQATLGFYIPEDQDWVMTKDITATIGVNLSLDQNYTVAVYDQNPLFNSEAVYYGQAQVSEGGRVNLDLNVPSYMTGFYVAAYDSKFRPVVQYATLQDGVLKADLGDDASTARTRATEAEFPAYAKSLNDFLNPTIETCAQFVNINDSYKWMVDQNKLEVVDNHLNVEDMRKYTQLTESLIANNRTTLSNLYYGMWEGQNGGAYLGNGDGKHFYVPSGEEVSTQFHINSTEGKVNETVIYVEGILHVGTNYTLNGVTIVVGNGGKLVVDGTANFTNAGRFIVMAGGQVTGVAGSSLNNNNGMPCYNAGTINTAGEININGSNFYNCGNVTADVLRNTSGGLITNFGKITARTNMGAADAYNCTFVNACYMHYTEQAGIGHLTMLKNSRLDVDGLCEFNQSWTKSFDATDPRNALTYVPDNPNILMDKSVVNVGSAYVTNTVFQGPSTSGEVAIVKMGKVQVGNGTDLMQRQNCYFDWNITELYNKQNVKYEDIPADQKVYNPYGYLVDYYRVHITKFITEATSPVSIPAGDCTGSGYNPGGGGGGGIGGSKPTYTYAFEDNRARCDFDLNDVVIWVKENEANSDKIDITLVAAGCQYDNYVYLGDTRIEWARGAEVHDALGVAHGVMFNTQSTSVSSSSFVTKTIDKPAGFNIEMADFKIKPYAKGSDPDVDEPYETIGISALEYLQTRHTIAPLGLVFPCKWQWPTERTIVSMAYEGFDQWGSAPKADVKIDALEWYKSSNAISGKVVLTN